MFDFIKNNLFLWIIIFLIVVAPSLLFGAVQIFGIIILTLFVLMLVGGFIFKWKLRKFAEQQQQRGGNPFGGFQGGTQGGFQGGFQGTNNGQNNNSRGNGANPKVKIVKTDATAATEKKVSDKVGDYVDFEEIKE